MVCKCVLYRLSFPLRQLAANYLSSLSVRRPPLRVEDLCSHTLRSIAIHAYYICRGICLWSQVHYWWPHIFVHVYMHLYRKHTLRRTITLPLNHCCNTIIYIWFIDLAPKASEKMLSTKRKIIKYVSKTISRTRTFVSCIT